MPNQPVTITLTGDQTKDIDLLIHHLPGLTWLRETPRGVTLHCDTLDHLRLAMNAFIALGWYAEHVQGRLADAHYLSVYFN